jgi:signal transduction histidine kinase
MPNIVANSASNFLLKTVFCIYLIITFIATFLQITNQYIHDKATVINNLKLTQIIIATPLTEAVLTHDNTQLNAILEGIQNSSVITGFKIEEMHNPSSQKPLYSIQSGSILAEGGQIISVNKNNNYAVINNKYLKLIANKFPIQKKSILLGYVTLYSSNAIIYNNFKYNLLTIIISFFVKTIITWFLFGWAFNKILIRPLDEFCEVLENLTINPVEIPAIKIRELTRIQCAFNRMLQQLTDSKKKLDELNTSLEHRIALRTQVLEQLNKEKSDYLFIAAHDLKNPLITIINFANIIKKIILTEVDKEKLLTYTGFIEERAKTMLTLIGNIIDVERIESKDMLIQPVHVDILAQLNKLLSQYNESITNKAITLKLNIRHKNYIVLTDIIICQIFDNLISNAIKYSPLKNEVIISLTKKNTFVYFEIQNQGQGLTSEDKKNYIQSLVV